MSNETVFFFKNGRIVPHHCESTMRKDSWTAERKAEKAKFMTEENARRKPFHFGKLHVGQKNRFAVGRSLFRSNGFSDTTEVRMVTLC